MELLASRHVGRNIDNKTAHSSANGNFTTLTLQATIVRFEEDQMTAPEDIPSFFEGLIFSIFSLCLPAPVFTASARGLSVPPPSTGGFPPVTPP